MINIKTKKKKNEEKTVSVKNKRYSASKHGLKTRWE